MMEQVVSANLWQAIKTDGRLEYRGQPGIRAHLTAMVGSDPGVVDKHSSLDAEAQAGSFQRVQVR